MLSICGVPEYDSPVSKKRTPRSYAWRTNRVKASWPRSRWTRPENVPVPNARRVTLTPELPSVTQSEADLFGAHAEPTPRLPANAAAARLIFRNSRLSLTMAAPSRVGRCRNTPDSLEISCSDYGINSAVRWGLKLGSRGQVARGGLARPWREKR